MEDELKKYFSFDVVLFAGALLLTLSWCYYTSTPKYILNHPCIETVKGGNDSP